MNTEGLNNIEFSEVIAIHNGAWDLALYFMLLLEVVVLVLLFNGSLRDVIMMAIVMLSTVADKVYLFGYLLAGALTVDQAVVAHQNEFPTLVARVAMFTLPFVITTQTKIKGAKPFVILLAISTSIYFLAHIAAEWVNR